MFGKRGDETRTAEDRARAAAERAARRAGRPLPPEAFQDAVRPPGLEDFSRPEPPPPAREQHTVEYEPTFETEEHTVPEPPNETPRVRRIPRHEEPEGAGASAGLDVEDDDAGVGAGDGANGHDGAGGDDLAAGGGDFAPRGGDFAARGGDGAARAAGGGDFAARGGDGAARAADGGDFAASGGDFVAGGDGAARAVGRGDLAAGDGVLDDVAPNGTPDSREDVFATADHDLPPDFATAGHDLPADATAEHPLEPLPAPKRRPAPATPRKRTRAAAPPPGASGSPKRGRPAWWGRRLFGLVALLVIVFVLYSINATFQPFHGAGKGEVTVTIPQGTDAGQIGKILEKAGVVGSARYFSLNATVTGRRGDLHPGKYVLEKDMANGDVLAALTKGPKGAGVVKTFKVTVIEGPSRKENAEAIDKSAVQGDYLKATAASSVLQRIRGLGAPKGTKTAEGFLFPATYDLKSGATASQLVSEQLDAFKENFGGVSMSYAKSKHLTRYDVLIIASMIEREVQVPKERALVSAVIYNRLKRHMPLAIDATIRYYTNNWQRPIRESELQADEPYNSRLHTGLPPTPIGNPGLASIKAAAHPAHVSYLYYVRKPGKSGEHNFSSSEAKFEQDVQAYQNAQKSK